MEMMTLKLRVASPENADTYRSYYLVTDGGHMAGLGRASVVPMSKNAPMPEQDFVEVNRGGEELALKTLVDTLLGLPDNQGLIAELNNRPS